MLRLPPFAYRRPATVAEAVAMRADAGPAGQYVAGGTDLYPNMKRRQETPAVIVDVADLSALPEGRRSMYNYQRQSKVLIKKI